MGGRVYEEMREGLLHAIGIAQGSAPEDSYRVHLPDDIDVRAVRKSTGLTQAAFAARFGFTLARLRDLEQGRTRPDSALRAYLMVIQKEPEAVARALAA